ncbi:hypothetical protein LMG22037_02431 [Paraburkholderia phenoliruptrix]|uniref:Uncharacterized protein n=1 Tax=Paraburkholderia phenoliruptrix TaxID=252970 RepID=A0A6J5AVN6_9BURK|nr:hypothetical protein LMG22037_02431 [Paraburkholderia phenoliruptrix]
MPSPRRAGLVVPVDNFVENRPSAHPRGPLRAPCIGETPAGQSLNFIEIKRMPLFSVVSPGAWRNLPWESRHVDTFNNLLRALDGNGRSVYRLSGQSPRSLA